jgi:hypothetical protein
VIEMSSREINKTIYESSGDENCVELQKFIESFEQTVKDSGIFLNQYNYKSMFKFMFLSGHY